MRSRTRVSCCFVPWFYLLALATDSLAQIAPILIVPIDDLSIGSSFPETANVGEKVADRSALAQPEATTAPVVLFRDDFNGNSLDASKWTIGTWTLGRTQLGNAPTVSGGIARLKFDTFNPGNSARSFLGTEIGTKAVFSRGSGIEFEARVRVNSLPAGLVTSFFTYVWRETTGITFSDEIDFEFLSKQINSSPATSEPVLTTTWNDWNNNTPVYNNPSTYNSQNVNVPGLNLAAFNTILIRWLPDRVEWWINGQPIRTATTAVPDEATNIRLNFWAPASGWTDAYSSKLTFAKNARQNQTFYYDVDYVEVRALP